MNADALVCRVALPVPVPRLFDYRWPTDLPANPGSRVLVTFANRKLVGVVLEFGLPSIDIARIKPVHQVIDPALPVPEPLLELARWAAAYYCHPIGEVAATMLPTALRRVDRPQPRPRLAWNLTSAGRAVDPGSLTRAPRQRQALESLTRRPMESDALLSAGVSSDVLRRLADKGWVERISAANLSEHQPTAGPSLTEAQAAAVAQITAKLERFSPLLLEGITGSGKTEVYLAAIRRCLELDRQALVIVPEIGLTPQLSERFRQRLGGRLAVVHSGLGDPERAQTWVDAARGRLDVVIGTRSAVFTPLPRPGLIVVDEEHDLSLKQQDGLHYSARDLAVQRAKMLDIPVVLGSATPSLESIHNAETGKYDHAVLPRRPGAARLPEVRLIDVRGHLPEHGLSGEVLQALDQHLSQGGQALVFLNRRGFAPVLICNACGWTAECRRCDARMTFHQADDQLRCHHCGMEQKRPMLCPDCGSSRVIPLGVGTERLAALLQRRFSQVPVHRIDRDTVRGRTAFADLVTKVMTGQPCILVGTQMLAKGHDFPGVTLVCVVNIDQALFSSDFRATERTAQLLTQVSGRAGRNDAGGTVLLQTHHPDHPLFEQVLRTGYGRFARLLIRERQAAAFPPCGHMALLRAEALKKQDAERFLDAAMGCLPVPPEVDLYGPMPSPMERRAGRYRLQLLLLCPDRGKLQRFLRSWSKSLFDLKDARRARWSLDVDPQDSI